MTWLSASILVAICTVAVSSFLERRDAMIASRPKQTARMLLPHSWNSTIPHVRRKPHSITFLCLLQKSVLVSLSQLCIKSVLSSSLFSKYNSWNRLLYLQRAGIKFFFLLRPNLKICFLSSVLHIFMF